MREIAVTEHEADQRLDRFLRKLLANVPLGAIFQKLRNGAIRVDGKKAKPDLRLVVGMRLELRLPDADFIAAPPAQARAERREAAPLDDRARTPRTILPRIVLRDDDVLVVDKPAGLAVQPGSGQSKDLVQWLQQQPFGVRTATFRPAPAHRLDRGTSGLVAMGLSPLGLRGLTAAFRDDQVEKVYLAVVHGLPPQRGGIDAPLLEREGGGTREPKVVVDPAGKPARTDYERIAIGPDRALLRLRLHTGRLHQIRAHLRHLGHPIIGDRRYGSTLEFADATFLLHAAELVFPHPRTGERVRCEAPMPAVMQRHAGSA
jgi:23S rRNA pseudouridine955/2504/2580 synthase